MIQVTGYPTLAQGLEYLKQYVRQREERGERTVVFSEDRLTLLAEQAICEEAGGSFLAGVYTFARFLQRQGKTLSKQGSVMVIGKLLSDNAEKLRCFSARTSARNGAAAVYEMISQLAASKVTPDMLRECEVKEGLLKDKLDDLALIYGEYLAFLRKGGYLDENSYLSLLPEVIRNDEKIRGASVVFLGFNSFTAQALDGVRAACESAKDVLGLLPAGKGEIYTAQAATAFKRICAEYGEIKVSQLKIAKEDKRAADVLREKLYDPTVFSRGYSGVSSQGSVYIRRLHDKEEELQCVSARIKKYVLGGGRFSDVSVFLPDMQEYSLLLDKVFREYKIPYFADFKRPLSAHPFAFFLFSLLRAVSENGSPSAVQAVASSPYFGDSGDYRNYLAKFCNYRGGVKREIKSGDAVKGYNTEYLKSMRERLLSGMGVFSRKAKGADFCAAVRKVYELFDVGEKTKTLVEACDDRLQKEYLSRMEKELGNILAETETWIGGMTLTVKEFSDVLKSGLEACELSLLPLCADSVFVGDLTQSRTAGSEIVFVLGMNDKVPMRGEDTALLSDADMRKLDEVKIRIDPSVAQVNARTKESVCLNLCSFTEKLYLSYSTDGEEDCAESDILRFTKRIFSDTQDTEDLFLYEVSEPMPALKSLLRHKDNYREGMDNERTKYASLYAALTKREEVKERAESLFAGISLPEFVNNGQKLFFASEGISPTLLENYHSCPYKNFAEKGLRLKEREEAAVLVTDTGNFVHAVLEETAKRTEELPTEESCTAFAGDFARELLKKPAYASLSDTAAGTYKGERLVEECVQVALEMYRQIKNSNFKVKYTEYRCVLPEEGMFGKIDRVDECGEYVRIIDYKTGKTDDSPSSYYAGVKMQLQLYMSAVSAGKTPAGIYYFPASVKYVKEGEEPFRMSGFMNSDKEVIRNSDTTLREDSKEKSKYFDASYEGGRSDKLMNEEDFRLFIDYSVLSGRRSIRELKEGFIAPTPYGSVCEYCAYSGMCGMFGDITARKKCSDVKCSTVAEIVRREKEGNK